MADRSYEEGGHIPPAHTHGSPRRTVVYILAQACGYLFEHGCVSLGHECRNLLNKAEQAVTDKCVSRGLRCDTVPFIRHAWMKVSRVIYELPSHIH